jgi:hypothetical protein
MTPIKREHDGTFEVALWDAPRILSAYAIHCLAADQVRVIDTRNELMESLATAFDRPVPGGGAICIGTVQLLDQTGCQVATRVYFDTGAGIYLLSSAAARCVGHTLVTAPFPSLMAAGGDLQTLADETDETVQ